MNVDEALFSHLSTTAGITALVGTRIYPIVMPPGVALPAISLQKISTERIHAFQQDTGMASASFQVSAWAKTDTVKKGYAHTQACANAVRLALQNYSGTMGGAGGVVVGAVSIENEMDDYDAASDVYAVHQDYEIWFQEV